MRAFIYDRHATTSTVILDIRLDRCRAYAESRGWDVAGIWLDLGDHALSHHRPQFDALCVAMDREAGPIVCLVDDWDRLTRDAGQSSVMRHRIGQAGGHTVTAEGESDAPAEKARGRLRTPPDPGRYDPAILERTTALIEAAGYEVDRDLWRGPTDTLVSVAADCQHSDDSGTIVITPKPKPKAF